MDKAS